MNGTNGPRICIVGAGPCGLTALKNMRAAGLDQVVCYDEGTAIGGNWAFSEDPARMSVYECTHLISSAPLSQFEDFPIPADYPVYPSHRQMLDYFESYASHFGLKPFMKLNTRVERAARRGDGRWQVSISGGGDEFYDHLIVCSGHHREPLFPGYPGAFTGESLHSAAFKRRDPYRGKRVLVVGAGNSACDIAVDISAVAARTCISMRRGQYIAPKVVLGKTVDAQFRRARHLPRPVMQFVLTKLLRFAIGPYERYGLQSPTCGALEMHPTLNSSIFDALTDGRVRPRVGIERLDGTTVNFRDGKAEDFDTIIWATGFRTTIPFLDASIIDFDTAGAPPLYLKMMHRQLANLFFIGFFQPFGCIWRLADHQARIAALQIVGRLERPDDIGKRIDSETRFRHRHFDPSPRHATEVMYYDFQRALIAELSRARN